VDGRLLPVEGVRSRSPSFSPSRRPSLRGATVAAGAAHVRAHPAHLLLGDPGSDRNGLPRDPLRRGRRTHQRRVLRAAERAGVLLGEEPRADRSPAVLLVAQDHELNRRRRPPTSCCPQRNAAMQHGERRSSCPAPPRPPDEGRPRSPRRNGGCVHCWPGGGHHVDVPIEGRAAGPPFEPACRAIRFGRPGRLLVAPPIRCRGRAASLRRTQRHASSLPGGFLSCRSGSGPAKSSTESITAPPARPSRRSTSARCVVVDEARANRAAVGRDRAACMTSTAVVSRRPQTAMSLSGEVLRDCAPESDRLRLNANVGTRAPPSSGRAVERAAVGEAVEELLAERRAARAPGSPAQPIASMWSTAATKPARSSWASVPVSKRMRCRSHFVRGAHCGTRRVGRGDRRQPRGAGRRTCYGEQNENVGLEFRRRRWGRGARSARRRPRVTAPTPCASSAMRRASVSVPTAFDARVG